MVAVLGVGHIFLFCSHDNIIRPPLLFATWRNKRKHYFQFMPHAVSIVSTSGQCWSNGESAGGEFEQRLRTRAVATSAKLIIKSLQICFVVDILEKYSLFPKYSNNTTLGTVSNNQNGNGTNYQTFFYPTFFLLQLNPTYMKRILQFKNITFKSSYNWFKIDIHQQLRPLTANYLAMFKVISTTICT